MRKLMKHSGLSEIGLVLSVALLLAACGGGSTSTTNNDSSASPAVSPSVQASPLTGFEKDLQFIKNGQYTYVWVFSRKDGKALEPADSIFLRANAPQVVDWVTTDGGKKVIAGTNFNLEEGNLEALKKRFVTEDYSGR
jgi:hypothetical protein